MRYHDNQGGLLVKLRWRGRTESFG